MLRIATQVDLEKINDVFLNGDFSCFHFDRLSNVYLLIEGEKKRSAVNDHRLFVANNHGCLSLGGCLPRWIRAA